MRYLSAAMRAALQQATREDALRVKANATQTAGLAAQRWTRWAQPGGAETPHAAAVTQGGTLLRAWNDAGVWLNRVPTPASGSDYATAAVIAADATAATPVALCRAGATAWLAYVNASGLAVRSSADDGVSWSAATAVVTGVSPPALALAGKDSGDLVLFYPSGGNIVRVRYTGGAWGAELSQSSGLSSVSGLAADWDGGDFPLAWTGTSADGASALMRGLLGDGGRLAADAWQVPAALEQADAASGSTLEHPALAWGAQGLVTWVERRTAAPARQWTRWASLRGADAWDAAMPLMTEPRRFDATLTRGLALAAGGGVQYFASNRAELWVAALSGADVDLSARAVSARWSFAEAGGATTVVLDDADGGLADLEAAGLALGGTLKLAGGVRLADATVSYSEGPAFIVTRLERVTERGHRRVVVEGRAWDWLLERWHAPRDVLAPSGLALWQMLGSLWARAGIGLLHAGAASVGWYRSADWHVGRGSSGLAALRTLHGLVPERVAPTGGALVKASLWQASDASVYNYGWPATAGAQSLREFRAWTEPTEVDDVLVWGSGTARGQSVVGEESAMLPASWLVREALAADQAWADEVAAELLRRARVLGTRGEMESPPNPAHEPGDVVTVSDGRQPAVATTWRVLRVTYEYTRAGRGKQRAGQKLELVAP